MSEPVERRLSPERLSQARRVFTDYWGWHPEAVQRAGNDLLAEVDALRAELDATALDLRSHRAEVETLYGERDKWRAEVREARAERDAAAPILEAAKAIAYAFEGQDVVERAHGRDFARLSPSADLLIERVAALVAALFPDDLPAPEEKP
jgi:uncharacterized coiled-coil DUF342 family protein